MCIFKWLDVVNVPVVIVAHEATGRAQATIAKLDYLTGKEPVCSEPVGAGTGTVPPESLGHYAFCVKGRFAAKSTSARRVIPE